jgi:hypothetical protein
VIIAAMGAIRGGMNAVTGAIILMPMSAATTGPGAPNAGGGNVITGVITTGRTTCISASTYDRPLAW